MEDDDRFMEANEAIEAGELRTGGVSATDGPARFCVKADGADGAKPLPDCDCDCDVGRTLYGTPPLKTLDG